MSTIDPTQQQPTWKPGDVANGHILGEDGTWRRLPPARPPKPKTERWYRHRLTLALVIAGTLPLVLLFGTLIVMTATGNGPRSTDLRVTGTTYAALNPSTLVVSWVVRGEPGDTGSCTVRASDPSGAYDGSKHFVEVEVPAEGWGTANATLEIDNAGAAWVTDVTVTC